MTNCAKTGSSRKGNDMDVKKLKIGKRVSYTARSHEGRGIVTDVSTKLTGTWVVINNPSLNKYVSVRPSQVHSA